MITSTTFVPTASGDKYVQQLCKHWAHKLAVDLDDQRGVVRFPDAVATMVPRADGIDVTIESASADTVTRMQDVVAKHLDRFAFREAPLAFAWSQPA